MKAYLRYATERDMDLVFEWTNDPLVRRNSFSMEVISYEEHRKWFLDLLSREDMCQYIYMHGENPVGQIRIHLAGEEAEISYSIAPKYRCMGYGKKMISALRSIVKRDYPNVKRLVAQVKPENVASQKVFMDCGYYEKCREFILNLKETEKVLSTDKGV